jgi:hypothetical protein
MVATAMQDVAVTVAMAAYTRKEGDCDDETGT